MNSKKNRVCPHCGDILQLVPPNTVISPTIVRCDNSKPYYITCGKFRTKHIKCRIYKYTSQSHQYCFPIHKERIANVHKEHGVYLEKAKSLLKKDRIFNTRLIMFCSNCKSQIALNRNPLRLVYNYWVYPLPIMMLAVILFPVMKYTSVLLISTVVFEFLLCLISTIYFLVIKHYYSNFVEVDECDRLIKQNNDIVIKLPYTKLRRLYLDESNILTTKFNNKSCNLYINHTVFESNVSIVSLHLCKMGNEYIDIMSSLNNAIENGTKIIIPILFEDKHIENAEVIEVNNII